MSSDSKNDLGFVVDEFSELRQSMKSLCFRHFQYGPYTNRGNARQSTNIFKFSTESLILIQTTKEYSKFV